MSRVKSDESDLFRTEAIDARRDSFIGHIVLSYPAPVWWLSGIALFSFICLGLFISFGEYTKRTAVSGQLTPSTGTIKIYPSQSGVVIEKKIEEGQHVNKGDVLYVVTGDRRSHKFDSTLERISEQILNKEALLTDEIEKLASMHREDIRSLNHKIDNTNIQISTLSIQISEQKQRIKLAEDATKRYGDLLANRYISKDQFQQKQSDLLDQQLRLRELQRTRTSAERELQSSRSDLHSLPLRQSTQISELKRQKIESRQALIDNESRRLFIVHAPSSGIVTFIIGEVGQNIDPGRPLLNLLPDDQPLYADVYAPGKAIGFVKPGDTVLLRYSAYPYQKFGTYGGKVKFVSMNPMTPNEIIAINGGIPGLDPTKTQDFYYRVSIVPDSQLVKAYGKTVSLRSGTVLEAEILQDNRKIYEWMLDPIVGLRGKWL
ncbi:HlyD family secretion protein [Burkholderia sp. F1]|uniref:HlyD family secretion protein n=1 Tax=Burkholderia sp. F1 TaxID=3366817 RepID=UPI003D7427F7